MSTVTKKEFIRVWCEEFAAILHRRTKAGELRPSEAAMMTLDHPKQAINFWRKHRASFVKSGKWQDGEKGEAMREQIENLDAALDALQNAHDYLESTKGEE